ncbi:MAG: hypothetical protein AAGG48_21920 [Planctomycetota bacterium]
MTNPYAAPIEKSESASGSAKRSSLVGVGCFLMVFLGLFVVAFAFLFLAQPAPVVVPGPVPVGTPAPPAPTTVNDQNSIETTPAEPDQQVTTP